MATSVSQCECWWARPYHVWQRECLSVSVLDCASLTVLRLFPVHVHVHVRTRPVRVSLMKQIHVLRHSAALLMMQRLKPSPSLIFSSSASSSNTRYCWCCWWGGQGGVTLTLTLTCSSVQGAVGLITGAGSGGADR